MCLSLAVGSKRGASYHMSSGCGVLNGEPVMLVYTELLAGYWATRVKWRMCCKVVGSAVAGAGRRMSVPVGPLLDRFNCM